MAVLVVLPGGQGAPAHQQCAPSCQSLPDHEKLDVIDSRPSDAIAIAVRYGAPIYVAEKVMAEASFVSEGGEEEKAAAPNAKPEQEEPPNPQLSQFEQLAKRLDDAIAKEDYEKAAQLRDELKKLQGRNS